VLVRHAERDGDALHRQHESQTLKGSSYHVSLGDWSNPVSPMA
jgi:hypothetical protein